MAEEFDFAITGAGIGGLTAANELKDSGKLLVMDKLFRPGGTSYSFKRDGYEFLTGPLGFSHPNFVNSWLNRNGFRGLEFTRKDYHILAGDVDISISGPLEQVEKELITLFPHENAMDKNRFYGGEVEVSFISGYDELAPEGSTAVMLRAPFRYDDCKFDSKEKYYEFKEKVSEELLEIVEPLVPNIVSANIMDASTPLTYETWGGRYRGSVPGWDWTDEVSRCMVRTPLNNFYLCGIYSFSIPFLGAFPTSMYSGSLAAQFIKEGDFLP